MHIYRNKKYSRKDELTNELNNDKPTYTHKERTNETHRNHELNKVRSTHIKK